MRKRAWDGALHAHLRPEGGGCVLQQANALDVVLALRDVERSPSVLPKRGGAAEHTQSGERRAAQRHATRRTSVLRFTSARQLSRDSTQTGRLYTAAQWSGVSPFCRWPRRTHKHSADEARLRRARTHGIFAVDVDALLKALVHLLHLASHCRHQQSLLARRHACDTHGREGRERAGSPPGGLLQPLRLRFARPRDTPSPMAEYNPEMRDAAYDGEVEKMNEFLDQGAEINYADVVSPPRPPCPPHPPRQHFLHTVPLSGGSSPWRPAGRQDGAP